MKKLIAAVLFLAILLGVLLPGCSFFDGSPGVLIYELYTAGGYSSGENYAPYLYSYAVLYNSSNETVDLTGWSLKFGESNATEMKKEATIPLNGTIEAGKFYVIQGGSAPDLEKFIVGGELPFDVDLDAPEFTPPRKAGIVALCTDSGLDATRVTKVSSFLSDYLAYAQEDSAVSEYMGDGPAVGISVKKVLRRVSFVNGKNNATDFMTKDIIDKPANIIYYTKGLTAEQMSARADHTNSTVAFSHEAGYYSEEFTLNLSTDLAANAKIYYTTDGSAPISSIGEIAETAIEYNPDEGIRIYDRTGEPSNLMAETGMQPENYDHEGTTWPPVKQAGESESAYQTRITELFNSVYKANAIRAAAVNDDKAVTPTITASFFVSEKNFEERYGLPVISLVFDKESLFDEKDGIFKYENMEGRGDDAYRPGVIQFFEDSGALGFEESMKFCLNGGYTRVFPQKSLRINMSNTEFNYDLFDGKAKDSGGNTITYFDRFILRAGGNDWGNGAMRDPFWQEYCSQLGTFDYQAQRPCVVFMNGEFWGMYFMAERQDDYFINSHYGIDRDKLTIAESLTALREGSWDDVNELVELRDYIIANDMSLEANYKYFISVMDVDSYIDYFICELYCGNTDWPNNNLKCWKSSSAMAGETGAKWRMIMNDVDFSFWMNSGTYDQIDWIMNECEYEPAFMFRSLMDNDEFRNKFIDRFEYLLDNFFIKEDIFAALDKLVSETATVRTEHRNRWLLGSGGVEYQINFMKTYISERNDTMRKGLDSLKNR